MLPNIEVPDHLVELRKARDSAMSDAEYIWGLGRVYGDTTERRVEFDIQCSLADQRKYKAVSAYEIALKNYLESSGGFDV